MRKSCYRAPGPWQDRWRQAAEGDEPSVQASSCHVAVWLRIPRGSALCREAQNLDFHVKMMTLQLKERQWQGPDQALRGGLSAERTSELKRAWGEGMMKPCDCVGWGSGEARAEAPVCSRNTGDWCDCAQ